MKRFLVLALVVVFLASAGNQSRPLSKKKTQPTCLRKNPLIDHFRILGVQIYRVPQKTSDVCPKEWKGHGTCCNPEHAGKVTEDKMNRYAKSLNEMVEHLESMGQNMKQILDKPLKIIKLKSRKSRVKPIEFPLKLNK